jgi:hypothetical protein
VEKREHAGRYGGVHTRDCRFSRSPLCSVISFGQSAFASSSARPPHSAKEASTRCTLSRRHSSRKRVIAACSLLQTSHTTAQHLVQPQLRSLHCLIELQTQGPADVKSSSALIARIKLVKHCCVVSWGGAESWKVEKIEIVYGKIREHESRFVDGALAADDMIMT